MRLQFICPFFASGDLAQIYSPTFSAYPNSTHPQLSANQQKPVKRQTCNLSCREECNKYALLVIYPGFQSYNGMLWVFCKNYSCTDDSSLIESTVCLEESTLSRVWSGTLIPVVSMSATIAMAAWISPRSRQSKMTSSYNGLKQQERKIREGILVF